VEKSLVEKSLVEKSLVEKSLAKERVLWRSYNDGTLAVNIA
jgi:hypothetical protein